MQITAICVDKTLISLNILNSNEHTYAAQRTRFPSRVCCAAWVCSFEFKILRLIRVLSAQIAAAATTAYIDTHTIFALVIWLRQLQKLIRFNAFLYFAHVCRIRDGYLKMTLFP